MPRIAFQGEVGAYGHQACLEARPDHDPLPCPTFEDAIEAVRDGRADLGMIGQNSATKFGRSASGSPSLDDQLRDMRLAPVLQLGVSYSF